MDREARVLVLEDDAHMREVLRGVLEDEGYQVAAVGRGEEAVERAAGEPFDLVVVDVRMEGIDGLEALARMQEHLRGAASLVVTGYASESDSIRALRLGVGDYLRKPFDLADFLDRVGALVARSRKARRQERLERALRGLGPWAAVAMARCLESLDLPRGAADRLALAGRLAGRLAAGAGLDSPEVEEVRVATMLLGVRRLFGGPAPEPDDPDCPTAVADALRSGDERWDGQGEPEGRAGEDIPLPARLADLALASAEAGDPPAEELRTRHPGRFDPLLLESLDGARAGLGRPAPAGGARERGLLGLGRALLGAGDGPSARRAFQQVVETSQGQEAVEAWLALAEAARRGSRAEEAGQSVRQALEVARLVGPAAWAQAALDGGLLLMAAGVPGAAGLLEEAAGRLDRLQMEADGARARLALSTLDGSPPAEESLAVLLRPENEPDLAGSSRWLLPLLLERASGPAGRRALQRLVRQAPAELGRLLEAEALSPEGRRAASALLVGAPGAAPPDLLQRLAGDPDPEVARQARAAMRSSAEAPSAPVLRIHSFGPLEAVVGEERVEERAWRARQVRFVFAYLAAREARPVTEDRLIEEFWRDDPEKGRRGVYWAVSVIRRCLKAWGPEPVLRARGLVHLNPDLPRWHDLDEVERAAAAARSARADRRASLASWRRVASLYRGPYLEGCYMDWALNLREHVESLVREALGAMHGAYQEAGMAGEALECARRLLDLDPLNQDAHRMALQSLVALGRPEEAVRQFDACQRTLRRELGMEPSIELLEAYHRARLSLP